MQRSVALIVFRVQQRAAKWLKEGQDRAECPSHDCLVQSTELACVAPIQPCAQRNEFAGRLCMTLIERLMQQASAKRVAAVDVEPMLDENRLDDMSIGEMLGHLFERIFARTQLGHDEVNGGATVLPDRIGKCVCFIDVLDVQNGPRVEQEPDHVWVGVNARNVQERPALIVEQVHEATRLAERLVDVLDDRVHLDAREKALFRQCQLVDQGVIVDDHPKDVREHNGLAPGRLDAKRVLRRQDLSDHKEVVFLDVLVHFRPAICVEPSERGKPCSLGRLGKRRSNT